MFFKKWEMWDSLRFYKSLTSLKIIFMTDQTAQNLTLKVIRTLDGHEVL